MKALAAFPIQKFRKYCVQQRLNGNAVMIYLNVSGKEFF
jgi:hypothetical protein